MYHDFYSLHTLPFENTVDPRFFFASPHHREALAAVEYTIRMRKGVVLITGDIGTGKTTVGRTMCQRCGHQAAILQVSWGHTDRTGLVRQILRGLELPTDPADDHAQLLDRLHNDLLQRVHSDRPIVLLVDEAQTLSDEALDELRLLSNFETADQKLLQIAIIGQPELRRRIADGRHNALRQRIVMAKHLRPLNLAETHQYIAHRLQAATVKPQPARVTFDAEAVHLIYGLTGGVPRLINIAADNCLLLGYVREALVIDPPIVRRVIADMIPEFDDAGQEPEDDQKLAA